LKELLWAFRWLQRRALRCKLLLLPVIARALPEAISLSKRLSTTNAFSAFSDTDKNKKER
jgi:hypothetical protein